MTTLSRSNFAMGALCALALVLAACTEPQSANSAGGIAPAPEAPALKSLDEIEEDPYATVVESKDGTTTVVNDGETSSSNATNP